MADSKFAFAIARYESLNIFDSESEHSSTISAFESACSFRASSKAESSTVSPFVSYFNKLINNPEKAMALKKPTPISTKFLGCIDIDI